MIKFHLALLILIFLMGTADSQMGGGSGGYISTGISGQVVDSYGQGISGARIWIIDVNGQAIETASNTTGGYSMILVPGSYNITAELSGYSFTSASVLVQTNFISTAPKITGYWSGAVPQATVSPSSGQYGLLNYSGSKGWLQGRVADQTGSGVPFAALNVDGGRTAYTTDQQGNYRLELSPGMHIIDPFKSGYGIPPRAAFVTAEQTANLDFIAKGVVALGRGRM